MEEKHPKNGGARPGVRVAVYGLLVALAFIFSYLESLLPSVGIPGVKLGLANLVVVVVLCGRRMPWRCPFCASCWPG